MKYFWCIFAAVLVMTGTSLSGIIIETPSFSGVLPHLDTRTLVIVDIDDTLLIPTQTLGTDVWFIYRMELYEKSGLSKEAALEKALSEWEAIRHLTGVKIVEKGSESILESLQSRGISVMGLSTQGLALATRTVLQLKSLGIDLAKTAPSRDDVYFMNDGHGVLFRNGILFTSGTNKGSALKHLFCSLDFHPIKVVFVNDKLSHLKDVECTLEAMNIPFVGLRYSHEDRRVAAFRKEIADIQWSCSSFGHILSDEEAEQILLTPRSL